MYQSEKKIVINVRWQKQWGSKLEDLNISTSSKMYMSIMPNEPKCTQQCKNSEDYALHSVAAKWNDTRSETSSSHLLNYLVKENLASKFADEFYLG